MRKEPAEGLAIPGRKVSFTCTRKLCPPCRTVSLYQISPCPPRPLAGAKQTYIQYNDRTFGIISSNIYLVTAGNRKLLKSSVITSGGEGELLLANRIGNSFPIALLTPSPSPRPPALSPPTTGWGPCPPHGHRPPAHAPPAQ